MSNKQIIEIEWRGHGSQRRSYGDHIWEAIITFSVPEGQMWASKFVVKKEQVEKYARVLVHDWRDKKPFTSETTMDEYFAPFLVALEEIEPNKWRVEVHEHFTD